MKRIFCVVPGFALTRAGATRPNSWKRGGKPHKLGGEWWGCRDCHRSGASPAAPRFVRHRHADMWYNMWR